MLTDDQKKSMRGMAEETWSDVDKTLKTQLNPKIWEAVAPVVQAAYCTGYVQGAEMYDLLRDLVGKM